MSKRNKTFDIVIAYNPKTKETRYFLKGSDICSQLGIAKSTWYNKSANNNEPRFLKGWLITFGELESY